MGWKADSILIRPGDLEGGAEKLLIDLGYRNLTALGDKQLKQVIWPDEGTLWVGQIGECVVISGKGLCDQFLKDKPTAFMNTLFAKFPKSDIAAVTLHSVVNLWGFALYQNGEPVRQKAGVADDGTFVDKGTALPEEQAMLAKSTLNAAGERIYRLPEFPDEDFREADVGEEFVFAIYARLTGERPDISDTLLETNFAGFEIPGPIAFYFAPPWWKFWGRLTGG